MAEDLLRFLYNIPVVGAAIMSAVSAIAYFVLNTFYMIVYFERTSTATPDDAAVAMDSDAL